MNSLSLEYQLTAALNQDHDVKILKTESYTYGSLFLNKITPDDTNPRYFPAIVISDKDAETFVKRQITKRQLAKIYDAENKVMIGKSCIINCCKYDSIQWKKVNKTIESIIELGDNLAVSEIIQAPTVYPIGEGLFSILTGHRRFFALVYANGINSAAHFKIYKSKPILTKTKQFQENSSREDLPQYGKLSAFQDAILEIDTLNNARKKLAIKPLTVREKANILGISMGAYDNYSVLCRYPAVLGAYENNNSISFVQMKKKVLDVEKRELVGLKTINVEVKRKINKLLEDELNGATMTDTSSRRLNCSKISLNYQAKTPSAAGRAFRKILTDDITKLDIGIEWDAIDWDNSESIKSVFHSVMEYLEFGNE